MSSMPSAYPDPARAVPGEYSVDFGRIFRLQPEVVLLPQSLAMLQNCFVQAREKGLRIAFRGGGQSFYGQTLCENGMVVGMRQLQPGAGEPELGDGWVKAPASMLLYDLQRFLRQAGLRLPVYTASTKATLGGTLAAGGISGRSYSRGLLASHVLEVELMGTDGRIWRCSAASNRDIFAYSVATMGVSGALLSARIRTEPLLPERVQLVLGKAPIERLIDTCLAFASIPEIASLEGFLNLFAHPNTADICATAEAAEKADIAAQQHRLQGQIGKFTPIPGAVRTFSIDSQLGFSASIGGWNPAMHDMKMTLLNKQSLRHNIPVSFVLPLPAVLPFLEKMARFGRAHPQYFFAKPYFAVINAMGTTEFEWLRLSARDRHVMGIDIFFTFPPHKLNQAIDDLNQTARLIRDHGGRIYPYAFLPEPGLLSQLLPEVSPRMKSAIRKTDPGGYLKPIFPI